MQWFRRRNEANGLPVADERRRAALSQEELGAGSLPPRARERLARQALLSGANGGPAWTSNLAVAEVLALRTLRVEPVAHVVGASVYRMPARAFKGKGNVARRELPAVSRALADVHARALRRLCDEASLVGAHGVVDVRIAYHEDEWGRSLIEAVARGTAVRVPDCPPLDPPFLGAMPAQDIGCLWRGGYTPVTIVTGCVAFYVSSTLTAAQQTIGADFGPRNIEINDRTVDLSEAWRRARRRLADAAESLGAEGWWVWKHADAFTRYAPGAWSTTSWKSPRPGQPSSACQARDRYRPRHSRSTSRETQSRRPIAGRDALRAWDAAYSPDGSHSSVRVARR